MRMFELFRHAAHAQGKVLIELVVIKSQGKGAQHVMFPSTLVRWLTQKKVDVTIIRSRRRR
jgi:hypothetical protein